MTLSNTASTADPTREEIHLRQIEMRGFRRSDGLFEVEGRILDRKPQVFAHAGGRTVPANAPIHDMGVRLVFDRDMLVHDVQTFTDSAPYGACPEGGRSLQVLKGLRMSSGWNREVRARLSGARSCTHLVEILGPMATTAFQSLGFLRVGEPEKLNDVGRPVKIDSCYAYAADGDLVRRLWPEFHLPAADAVTPGSEP
jgi:Protein of unknown function (DUF2889)